MEAIKKNKYQLGKHTTIEVKWDEANKERKKSLH